MPCRVLGFENEGTKYVMLGPCQDMQVNNESISKRHHYSLHNNLGNRARACLNISLTSDAYLALLAARMSVPVFELTISKPASNDSEVLKIETCQSLIFAKRSVQSFLPPPTIVTRFLITLFLHSLH